jgi:hypothetical protein
VADQWVIFTTKIGTPIDGTSSAASPRCANTQVCRGSAPLVRQPPPQPGVPIENIQDVLSHSSPTVAKTIYMEATRNFSVNGRAAGFLFDEERWVQTIEGRIHPTGIRPSTSCAPEGTRTPNLLIPETVLVLSVAVRAVLVSALRWDKPVLTRSAAFTPMAPVLGSRGCLLTLLCLSRPVRRCHGVGELPAELAGDVSPQAAVDLARGLPSAVRGRCSRGSVAAAWSPPFTHAVHWHKT